MKEQEVEKRIAYLEFVNDQLASEIEALDDLMRRVGFREGLATVKATAQEIFEHHLEEETGEFDDHWEDSEAI